MLFQVLEFIQREQVVSHQRLAREFQIDEQALHPMLKIWMEKGVIRPCGQNTGCQSSCGGRCRSERSLYYQIV